MTLSDEVYFKIDGGQERIGRLTRRFRNGIWKVTCQGKSYLRRESDLRLVPAQFADVPTWPQIERLLCDVLPGYRQFVDDADGRPREIPAEYEYDPETY